jgi:phenylacetate-CoA ligase
MSRGTGRLARFNLHKSPEDVDRAVRYVVQHAYRSTAHYRRLLDKEGISPADIRGRNELPLIPLTTRELFGESSWRAILSDRAVASRCRQALTSGSTGTLLPVHMDRAEAYYRRFLLLRAFYKNLHHHLPLRIVEVGPRHKRPRDDFAQKIGVVRVAQLRATQSSSESARIIDRFRPHLLTGPPSCLELLAEQWPSMNIHRTRLKLVVCRGEVLSDNSRERLQRVFQSRVVDYYSCEEVGNIAWECPDQPGCLHVNTDACLVELVDGEGRHVPFGEEGTVVITNLFACTMPFIRYSLGDRTRFIAREKGGCTCGNPRPLIATPSGRDEDFFVLPNGSRVSPRTIDNVIGHALYDHLEDTESLIRYRIIKEAEDRIRVEAILAATREPDLERALDTSCRQLHPGLRCELDLVDEFPERESNKLRRVVSRLR